MTDAGGNIIDPAVYTAFGEKVCSIPGGDCTNTADHRYGYAGAFGYQSTINDTTGAADFPFLHVGHRYYDPSSGRFLQRDPSGIRSGPSGPNVYLYVAARPLRFVDPLGLFSLESAIVGGILGGGVGAASGGTPPVILICAIAGFIGNGYEDGDAENFWEKVKKNPPNMPLPGDSIMMDCFVDGTPVWTTDGLVDIATINLGSRVLSTDPHGGDVSAQIIIGKRSRLVRELVVITLPYEILRCTSEHPFCTKGKGWVKAAQLSTGDILQDVTGTGVTIVKVGTEMVVDPIRVQTITVDGTHTYYVGKSRVLVHNKPLG
jgi:RHS repeat-associated protein